MKIAQTPGIALTLLLFCLLASTATAQIHGTYVIDDNVQRPGTNNKNVILGFDGAPRILWLKVDSIDIMRDSSFLLEYQMLTWGPPPTTDGYWSVSGNVLTLEYESCLTVCQDDWVTTCGCEQIQLRILKKGKLKCITGHWKGRVYTRTDRNYYPILD